MARVKDGLFQMAAENRTFAGFLAAVERRTQKGDKFSKDVDKAIRQFRPSAKSGEKAELQKQLFFAKIYHGVTPEEYFLFHFDKQNDEERREFVGSYEKDRICRSINTEDKEKLADKYEAYQTFKPYYKREMIRIRTTEDLEAFEAFVKDHPDFMIKAIRKAKGNDVFKITLKDDEDLQIIEDKIRLLGICVVEECIKQAPEMAALHPDSVNTIRYATWYDKGELTRMYAILRMGQGGSHIDNAGGGGIAASVDVKTGIVKTDGYCEDGNIYPRHPDTGVAIKGFQVPHWSELSDLIEEMVKVLPGQKFVGWDMALSTDGWVMVEGNSRPMITAVQMCEERGIRELVNQTLASR